MEKIKEFFKPANLKQMFREHGSELTSIAGLLLCIIIFTIWTGGKLWSPLNVGYIVEGVAVFFVCALGAIFIYSMGYMDVSLGSQLGVYCILLIWILEKTGSLALGMISVMVIALLCGVFNGVVSVLLGLPSIVTSLFLSSIFSGIQMIAVEKITSTYAKPSNTVKLINYDLSKIEVLLEPEVTITILVILCIIATYVFTFTRLGKYVKAIGANEVTTKQCGVNTTLWKTLGYSALGIAIAIASLFYLSRSGAASKDTGSGYAMSVMLCLILGGMPLSGGMRSKVRCAVIGALTYVLLDNGLTVAGVDIKVVHIIKALIFLAVVILTSRSKEQYLPR